jgi:hypothetical protein
MEQGHYHDAVAARDETNRQWLVGVIVAVAGILISAVVTLVAAGKFPCPVCGSSPTSTTTAPPAPVGTPEFTITPTQGTVPDQLTGTVSGFGVNEFVVITVDTTRIASVQTDSTGAASFSINLSSSVATGAPRDVTVVAQGLTSNTIKTAVFHVVAP